MDNEKRYNLALTPSMGLKIKAGNSKIELVGEDTEEPYLIHSTRSTDWEVQSPNKKEEAPIQIVEGESIDIKVEPEWEHSADNSCLSLHLPSEWDLRIKAETHNGRIEVQNLKGNLEATTKNGRIRFNSLGGSLIAYLANGSFEGQNLKGKLDISTSNGKVTVRESSLSGGSIKSANGKISLQIKPEDEGPLSIFSGNGRVTLALPEEGDYLIKVQTQGKLINQLGADFIRTETEGTHIQKGEGRFLLMVQNFRGGIRIVKYRDFESRVNEEEGKKDFKFDFNFDPGQGFERLFGTDFTKEIPKIMQEIAKYGSRFGKLGEEFSRKFHETFQGKKSGKGTDEVKMVLEMLDEGKITIEEAERLINAIKNKDRKTDFF